MYLYMYIHTIYLYIYKYKNLYTHRFTHIQYIYMNFRHGVLYKCVNTHNTYN